MDVSRAVDRWLADGKAQGWSARTIGNRRHSMDHFCWWLENEEETTACLDTLTPARIRAFLIYTREEHPEGRFGSDHPSVRRETRPSTVQTYFKIIRAFSNFCLAEGLISETPMRNVKAPRVPNDQIQPLAPEQVQALVDAARRSRAPERAVALVLILVDTGMRVSEVCALAVGDVDRGTGELVVFGKGNKKRRVYMGLSSRRALWRYLETDRRIALPDEPLFVSVGGLQAGAAMTPSGLFQVVSKLGQTACLKGVRCPPRTLRHTFAVSFLRAGGNLFELQQLMGHTDLTVLRRYVALAEADLAQAHRAASPADRIELWCDRRPGVRQPP
jgi:site-specific recombinase XerD